MQVFLSKMLFIAGLISLFFIYEFAYANFSADEVSNNPHGSPIGSEEINRNILQTYSDDLTFWFNFRHYDAGGSSRDIEQCGNRGIKFAPLNYWTPYIRVNTDDGWGGCLLQFALTDPKSKFPNLKLFVDFQPDSGRHSTQCPVPGKREILPLKNGPDWSNAIELQMDNKRGGCKLIFSMENSTDDLKWHIEVWPDDVGIDQCPTPTKGPHTPNAPNWFWEVTPKKSQAIILDTNGKWGGCQMRWRLTNK